MLAEVAVLETKQLGLFDNREAELESRLRTMIQIYENIKEERDTVTANLVLSEARNRRMKKKISELEDRILEFDDLRSEYRSLKAYVRAMRVK